MRGSSSENMTQHRTSCGVSLRFVRYAALIRPFNSKHKPSFMNQEPGTSRYIPGALNPKSTNSNSKQELFANLMAFEILKLFISDNITSGLYIYNNQVKASLHKT